MLIDGIHIPLTTPFNREGSLYLRKLEYNVGRYSLTPAAGFVALTGEGASLSDEEARDSLRVIGSTADAGKVLIAAISKGSVRNALVLAERAQEAGFDAVLLAAPEDWQTLTPSELLMFFQAVADASPLPVLLWSDGSLPGLVMSADFLIKLSSHPNILGLYDSALTLVRHRQLAEATREARHQITVTSVFAPVTRRMLATQSSTDVVTAAALAGGSAVLVSPAGQGVKTRSKAVGFQIMSAGSTHGLVDLLEAGAAGAMPFLAACTPQGCYEVYAALKDGDAALASEKEQRLADADRLLPGMGVAGIKYACDLNGYFGGRVRLPRLPLLGAQEADVERVLSGLRN